VGDKDALLVSLYASKLPAAMLKWLLFHLDFCFPLRRTRIGGFWKTALSSSALNLQVISLKSTLNKFLATVPHLLKSSTIQNVQEKPGGLEYEANRVCPQSSGYL